MFIQSARLWLEDGNSIILSPALGARFRDPMTDHVSSL